MKFSPWKRMQTGTKSRRDRGIEQSEKLTADLLIRAVLARTNVNKVEKHFPTREPARKLLESVNVVDGPDTIEHFREATDIGINAADNLDIVWNGIQVVLDILQNDGLQGGGSLASAVLTSLDEVIGENHAITIDEEEDKRIALL